MLCDNCKKNQANIHLSKIVNGVKFEQNLCLECAGATAPEVMNMFSGFGFGGTFEVPNETVMVGAPAAAANTLRQGMNEKDIEALGLKFPSFGVQTKSAIPIEKEETLEELKQLLASAINKEEYEKAAEIRDKIYVFEKKQMGEI